jgi:hypothetical protein
LQNSKCTLNIFSCSFLMFCIQLIFFTFFNQALTSRMSSSFFQIIRPPFFSASYALFSLHSSVPLAGACYGACCPKTGEAEAIGLLSSAREALLAGTAQYCLGMALHGMVWRTRILE